MAMCLNAFQVDLPPTKKPPFPDIDGFRHVPPPRSLG
jgi:hypothetical protein